MHTIYRILLLLTSLTLFSNAATRGDVKIIEASENIRYLSQKIVKDYLFYYQNMKKVEVKNGLDSSLNKFSEDFRRRDI